ncbi:MAG TPA: CHRD domain-containing protein [Gammaproteobacteria bacterium]
MKRVNLACFLAVPVFLFAAVSAHATLIPWSAELTPDHVPYEVDGLNGDEFGIARGAIDTDTLRNNWTVEWGNLTSLVFEAHFHEGPASVRGIEYLFAPFLREDEGLPPNALLRGSSSITGSDITDIFNGDWYIDVHTQLNPGGELRGWVRAVPEPGSLVMLGFALLGLVVLRRRFI